MVTIHKKTRRTAPLAFALGFSSSDSESESESDSDDSLLDSAFLPFFALAFTCILH